MCMEMKDLNASQHDIAEIWKVTVLHFARFGMQFDGFFPHS